MFDDGLATFLWLMLALYLFFLIVVMFALVFADILRRENISGWGKAGWVLLIFLLPLLGILIYVIVRPKRTEQERRPTAEAEAAEQPATRGSSLDDIARAKELLDQGAITEAEFNALKWKTLS